MEKDVRLENTLLLLRPLIKEDFNELKKIAFDERIWQFYPGKILTEEELSGFISKACEEYKQGIRIPFSIVLKDGNKIVGTTSFGNISQRDKRLEIGWTWLGTEYQHKGINKIAKYLLLKYAFEILLFERVEFKTDVLNIAARKALLKIGAVEEGILRSHTLMNSNRRRDTIYYSILKPEWENLKNTVWKEQQT